MQKREKTQGREKTACRLSKTEQTTPLPGAGAGSLESVRTVCSPEAMQ